MFEKVSRTIFCVLFLCMLGLPLLAINREEGKISEAENRRLAPKAQLYKEDGTLNENYTADFETWMNDNIGFRSHMVVTNARMQYYLFDVLSNNSNMYLGPNGELNYATAAILTDYQHLNLYSNSFLQAVSENMQTIADYAKEKNAIMIYYQCWDKHSIYPEHFPDTVIQHGEKSKTDGVVEAYRKYTDIPIVSSKEKLMEAKETYDTYSVWGDATHWTPRGAYIGYLDLMKAINAEAEADYRILQESDYRISKKDVGSTLFGGIHEIDYQEVFEIKNPKAVLSNEKLTLYAEDPSHSFFVNEKAGNDTRVLVLGDSYFNNFVIDDLAESFHETIIIWNSYIKDVQNILDEYQPDIVIIEAAERVDIIGAVNAGATVMKENTEGEIGKSVDE